MDPMGWSKSHLRSVSAGGVAEAFREMDCRQPFRLGRIAAAGSEQIPSKVGTVSPFSFNQLLTQIRPLLLLRAMDDNQLAGTMSPKTSIARVAPAEDGPTRI